MIIFKLHQLKKCKHIALYHDHQILFVGHESIVITILLLLIKHPLQSTLTTF